MQIITPLSRQTIQRGTNNAAWLTITGTYASSPAAPATIRARLLPVASGQGVATDWQELSFADGKFSGRIIVRGGWYKIDVEALTSYGVAQESATLDRFGVGEVVCVVGHSVAQGGVDFINGTSDDRVSTIPLETTVDASPHVKTGLIGDMPPVKFVQFGTGVRPAPFGPNCYFWSDFGGKLAARLNVPVLIYQTAFGGTNLEQWAKSSQGEPVAVFSLPPALGFPYVNLKHVLQAYLPITGLRALLIDHGQNDYQEKSSDVLLARYRQFVDQARSDARQPVLPALINRQTPFLTVDGNYKGGEGPQTQVRQMQERMAATNSCWPGPDYDAGLVVADRFDYIHLSLAGQAKASTLWAAALSDQFLRASIPAVLDPVTGTLPAAITDIPPALLVTTPLVTTPVVPLESGLTGATPGATAVPDLDSNRQLYAASVGLDLGRLSNLAALGLIVLGIASLAYILHQFTNRQ